MVKEKVVKNWKKTKQEIIIEYEKDAAVYGAMTGSVKEVKVDSAYQDGIKEEGGEIWRKVEEKEEVEEAEEEKEEEEVEEEKEEETKEKEKREEEGDKEEEEKEEEREDGKEKEEER